MSFQSELGYVVWHDLFTDDGVRAKHFYSELFGWEYQNEHTSDFVWQSGQADYPLIMANEEAHGGIIDIGTDVPSHWVAYVRVDNVNVATEKAARLGGRIERDPFDIPGVGCSAVVRDPKGAFICPYISTHSFPPPRGIFLWDELITDDLESASRFYRQLFGWTTYYTDMDQMGGDIIFRSADDTKVAGIIKRRCSALDLPVWVTYLATQDIDATIAKAKGLGASLYMESDNRINAGQSAVLIDPMGAIFGLLSPIV